MEEGRYTIAQANSTLNNDGIKDELVSCRRNLGFELSKPENIDFMDVSPKQVVSVASALIPFLENDDANRAQWIKHDEASCSFLKIVPLWLEQV